MTLAERIRKDVAAALKAGERDRASALRMLLSELQKEAKEGGTDEQAVLRRERKRRRDAEQAFRDGGRDELAARERAEAELIETYLPAELSDAELDVLVRRAIEQTGASGQRDMGQVIRRVMEASEGRADGRRVSTRVREALPA